MATISIDIEKVRKVLEPALAYQPQVKPSINADEKSPLMIIELPGAQAIDLKALEAVSTALCGYLGSRGQVGVVNGHLCLCFWKDDLKRDFNIEEDPAEADEHE